MHNGADSVPNAPQPEERTSKPVEAAAVKPEAVAAETGRKREPAKAAAATSKQAVQEPLKEPEAAPASKQRKEAGQDPNRMFGQVWSKP